MHAFSFKDAMELAAKKVTLKGWEAYAAEVVEGGQLITGCVPDGVYARGPKKGSKRFSKPVKGSERKVVVSLQDLQQVADKYESETGSCWSCKGSGEVFAGWSRDAGVWKRQCEHCGGSGKAKSRNAAA